MHKPVMTRQRAAWWRCSDAGAVTAEFSMVLPSVLIIILLLCGIGRFVITMMQCHDAATQVAYDLVIHHNASRAVSIAQQIAGSRSTVQVRKQGQYAQISVSAPLIPDPLRVLPFRAESHVTQIIQ